MGQDSAGKCPEAGENLGEQAVAGREPQGQLPGVADQPAGDGDELPPQGGDHGFAAADPVTGEDGLPGSDGGELVQPRGDARGEQRAPHPGGIRGVIPSGGRLWAGQKPLWAASS